MVKREYAQAATYEWREAKVVLITGEGDNRTAETIMDRLSLEEATLVSNRLNEAYRLGVADAAPLH